MGYGLYLRRIGTMCMLRRLLAALPKKSPDGASGKVVHGDEGERGRVRPDSKTEMGLLG
jgi:hypothetical protein